jgi:hypothetical protein
LTHCPDSDIFIIIVDWIECLIDQVSAPTHSPVAPTISQFMRAFPDTSFKVLGFYISKLNFHVYDNSAIFS